MVPGRKPAKPINKIEAQYRNMTPTMLAEAVPLGAGGAATEASGGMRLDNIGASAASGVDYLSVGRLMQSAPAADIGLDFELV